MYLEIFLADVAVFRVFLGILWVAPREISQALNIITEYVYNSLGVFRCQMQTQKELSGCPLIF